jgi:glycosyltransferase involved in cell wall biosynthesis
VIPVYDEEHAIEATLTSLRAHPGLSPERCEIIVVDDGSTDATGPKLAALDPALRVRVLRHDVNRGYGAAIKSGVRLASNELIVLTDADGTYPNERIPDLVRLADDCDMVVGARIGDDVAIPLLRRLPKWCLRRFANWLVGREIPDLNSGLRVLRKISVLRFIDILPDSFSFTTTITMAMMTGNYTVRYEPIDYYARMGKSKIRPIRDTLLITQLILRTGIYFAPLRVFLPIAGLLLLATGTSLGVDLARSNLTDKTVVLFVASLNVAMFALLADMIDKRSGRQD